VGERVRIHGLDAEVLASSSRGDGRHQVLRIEHAGKPIVLKLYGRKRDWLRDFLRDLGHRFLVRKTGMTPAARMRTERDTLELWLRHGFTVPRVLDIELPAEVPPLRLALEWIRGRSMRDLLSDPVVNVETKRAVLERAVREWTRRHELALKLREPRLVQAHATFGHVLVDGDLQTTFDFEVVWKGRNLERLIRLELLGFLGSFGPWIPPQQIDLLLDAVVEHYAPRDRLVEAARSWRGRREAGDAAVMERLKDAITRAEKRAERRGSA
jgi:hypothetical protein